jgi:peptide/nickel transport system substrate-binding protein
MLTSTSARALGTIIAAGLVCATPSVATAQSSPAATAQSSPVVLRVVPHANLTYLDPIWTSVYITRNHGYLVYDTLFALDASRTPRPEMVDTWTVSDDKLTWTFKLRDGLKWHDGQDVTAADCVASLTRWGKRDGIGQQLMSVVESLNASDPKTIEMKLKRPYGSVLESLAKLSSYVPFMMPKRVADAAPTEQITDYTGSGPFIFQKADFEAGKKAAYLKNTSYVPRSEPSSEAAGGKVVKIDRVQWMSFPTPAKAVDALIKGNVDYLEQPDPKFIPLLEKHKKDIVVGLTDPDGFIGVARFNHLIPPFDNPGVRRAVAMAMNPADYMKAALGDQKYWKVCASVYPCNSPLAGDNGNKAPPTSTLEAAKKALQEAGYDGTPVVLLNAVDMPVVASFTATTAEKLRKLGMKVEIRDTDWASMALTRVSRGPVAQGGWNMFHTFWAAIDVAVPTNILFSGDPDKGWFGWPKDNELERLRSAFALADDASGERKSIADNVQERVQDGSVFVPLGQFFLPVAYRKVVKGLIIAPAQFYWNMELTGRSGASETSAALR